MKKSYIARVSALFFALIMTFSLASCDGGGEETTAPVIGDIDPQPETTAGEVDLDSGGKFYGRK